MPNCVTCGTYFRSSPYNNSLDCDTCMEIDTFYDLGDKSVDVDMDILQNPSGKTQPRFEVDYNDGRD